MRRMLVTGLLLASAACSQEDAPAEKVAEAAEEIVEPAAEPTPLAKGEWAPRDTCEEVEGAGLFRRQLAAAVEARDADVLAALSAEDVKLDFGGGEGRAELRARLGDESRGLWKELDAILALGCSANEQGGIIIPWYFDQDMGETDAFTSMLVIGEDVPVLTEPKPSADKLDTISWDLVEPVSFDPQSPFQEIKVADGGTGFIATDKLRSLIDYRLTASSRNDRWRIISFVAGD
jgi:hypothetical protein